MTFKSLNDLAYFYGIPQSTLINKIDRYNEDIVAGVNRDFHKVVQPWMSPILKSPFYAMRMCVKTHYTCGGLVIDTSGRVLSKNNSIIEGLYAVGEVTGSTHGDNRLGSCSVTECLVMGRMVGQAISKQKNRIQ